PGLGQEPPAAPRLSMLTISLLYAGDDELHDALQLSTEQIARLNRHRKEWLTDYSRIPPADLATKGPELSNANDKALADILKPEQLKRLRELALQAVEKQFGGRALCYAEVAAELKLTGE